MNHNPELDVRVAIAAIARFAMNGHVYRAYSHALAADHGMLLLVPIELVNGDLTDLVDECPVPWEEVIAIIESPDHKPRPLLAHIQTILGRPLIELAPSHWDVDLVKIGAGEFGHDIARISHPSGIRLAVVKDLLGHRFFHG